MVWKMRLYLSGMRQRCVKANVWTRRRERRHAVVILVMVSDFLRGLVFSFFSVLTVAGKQTRQLWYLTIGNFLKQTDFRFGFSLSKYVQKHTSGVFIGGWRLVLTMPLNESFISKNNWSSSYGCSKCQASVNIVMTVLYWEEPVKRTVGQCRGEGLPVPVRLWPWLESRAYQKRLT